MNLNKQQAQQWQVLQSVFQAVSSITADEDQLRLAMKQNVDTFEALLAGKAKVKIRMTPVRSVEWVDCSRDALKVTKDANGLTMRARMEGIGVSSVVVYKDAYAHSNESIAEALETLAAAVRRLPSQIRDASESADLSSLVGLQASEECDEDEDVAAPAPAPAPAGTTTAKPEPTTPGDIELFSPQGAEAEPGEEPELP